MSGEPIRPDDPQEYALQRVRERLASDPRTNELEVRVSGAGQKVFLHGAVASDERRIAIAEVAQEAMPDHEIHNQTTVPAAEPAEEAEELA